jgi:hypothetical protein
MSNKVRRDILMLVAFEKWSDFSSSKCVLDVAIFIES